MFVHENDDAACPICGGTVGIGLKEEPSCWKVYEFCLEDRRCVDRRAGTVAKSAIAHDDEVVEHAKSIVG